MSTNHSPPHRTDDLVLSAAEHSTLSHATSGDTFDMSALTVPQAPVSSTKSIPQPLDGGEGEGGYVANQEDKDLDSGNPAPPPPSPAATLLHPDRPHRLMMTTSLGGKPFPRLGDLNDDDTLPNVEGATTWASRNPGKAVIPPRQRTKRVLGAEQRRTAKDRVKSKKKVDGSPPR
ncbi:hypothetical protein B0H14DRAFT_2605007 [Mycena olivaceomarginata]|nr:hypothetical protein B0H14DRAFT_2605007 [Mycena olivaceomarginata]